MHDVPRTVVGEVGGDRAVRNPVVVARNIEVLLAADVHHMSVPDGALADQDIPGVDGSTPIDIQVFLDHHTLARTVQTVDGKRQHSGMIVRHAAL